MIASLARWGRRNEVSANLLAAFGLTALAAAAFWRSLPDGGWASAAAAWFLAANAVAFAAYGYDKWRAGTGGRRVPELVLHALGLAFGSLGAYLGMRAFRHKTVKGRYRVVFWCVAAVQAAALLLVLKQMVVGG